METRTIETTGYEPEHPPSIRWGAVIAGFAVGVGVHLLLTLIGIAGGFAAVGAGARPDGSEASIAAAAWNTVSMLIAAFVGGWVAARSSSLRRSTDGVLHGIVSWGATVLFFAIVTGSVTGNAMSGMFGATRAAATTAATTGGDGAMTELFSSVERGDRSTAIGILRDRMGMSDEQAAAAVDRALSLRRGAETGEPAEAASDAAKAASIASTWLSAAILLSLIAGAGGGLVGARGARKRALPGRHGDRVQTRVTHHHVPTAG